MSITTEEKQHAARAPLPGQCISIDQESWHQDGQSCVHCGFGIDDFGDGRGFWREPLVRSSGEPLPPTPDDAELSEKEMSNAICEGCGRELETDEAHNDTGTGTRCENCQQASGEEVDE